MGDLEGIGLATIVCSWTLTILVFSALALQFYSKLHLAKRSFDGLDYMTILTSLCSLALVCQTTWVVVDEGQGKHAKDETPSQFEVVAKSLTANEVMWTFVTMLVRCTGVWFLLKIFATLRTNRGMLFVTLALIILHGTTSILAACLICQPISADWDPTVKGTCGDQAAAYIVFESVGLVLDFGIFIFPLRMVKRLELTTKRKVKIGSMFGIGGLSIIITVLRLASLHRATSDDFTYDRGFLGLLSCLGALTGALLGVIPGLAPLFNKIHNWISDSPLGFTRAVQFAQLNSRSIWYTRSQKQRTGERMAQEPAEESATRSVSISIHSEDVAPKDEVTSERAV